jgi:hypothetical protein
MGVIRFQFRKQTWLHQIRALGVPAQLLEETWVATKMDFNSICCTGILVSN